MKINHLDNIESLVGKGWDLLVTLHAGRFHASVFLHGRNDPDSYHYMATTVTEALAQLDQYVYQQLTTNAPTPLRAREQP